jgi:hypothetical protein
MEDEADILSVLLDELPALHPAKEMAKATATASLAMMLFFMVQPFFPG